MCSQLQLQKSRPRNATNARPGASISPTSITPPTSIQTSLSLSSTNSYINVTQENRKTEKNTSMPSQVPTFPSPTYILTVVRVVPIVPVLMCHAVLGALDRRSVCGATVCACMSDKQLVHALPPCLPPCLQETWPCHCNKEEHQCTPRQHAHPMHLHHQ